MGYLTYDGGTAEVQLDDRVLAHLQIVIITKIRRQESFVFSWKEPIETGDGRSTVWLAPTVGLRFKFAGSRAIDINPTWLDVLYASAASGRGLRPEPEPELDPSTALPGSSGAQVDWASDRPGPPRTRRARPPVG